MRVCVLVLAVLLLAPGTAESMATLCDSGPHGKTVLTTSGSGAHSTRLFSVPGEWQLRWSYSRCAGGSGNFIVGIYKAPHEDAGLGSVNQLGKSGSGTEYEHASGKYYLEVESECSWKVQVTR